MIVAKLCSYLLVLLPLKVGLVLVDGFAYAPNFITKIVQEQTGKQPVGLLEIEPSESSPPDDNNDEKKGEEVVTSSLNMVITTGPNGKPAADKEEDLKLTRELLMGSFAGDDETPPSAATAEVSAAQTSSMVTTRFPPEPNGYLHLGHAKAVCFNFAVARMFDGKCHMRLDDTNPTKEDEEYVESILADVKWIQSGLTKEEEEKVGPWDGPVRKTSDYFDIIYQCAEALIKQGDAYIESLSAEEMREYRGTLKENGRDSPYRNRSIEENLEMFSKMRDGEYKEGEHILRAKIDMASPNINMRDPALYRIKHESHQATGDKWCIYPMYDFSHPISDALEGISHSLCTLEFEDHRPFYDWTINKLLPTGLLPSEEKPPQQIEFSRLNIQSTVLSKRKLIQLVEQNHVNGWDDPRLPTMSGMRRRGIPPNALRLFCERVGISKADSNIAYSVLEDCVREEMDKLCPRAFCILKPLKVTITNWDGEIEDFEVPRHPKRDELGIRKIPFGGSVYIEREDFFDKEGPEGAASNGKPPKGFKRLLEHGRVRLRYAYVIDCKEVIRDPETQEPIELKCEYIPETRAGFTPEGMARVKGIIHWVEASSAVKCTVNQYDRLFKTEEPGRESGDFLKDINPNSLEVLRDVLVEPSVAKDALDVIEAAAEEEEEADTSKPNLSSLAYQFERSGYFALDKESTDQSNLAFNRVVTLRDTWGVDTKKNKGQGRTRGRGRGKQQQTKGGGGGAGVVEDVRRVAFRAATILSAGPHPEADSLLVCKVDCGDVSEDGGDPEPRTVVAGLAGKIPMDELVGQKIVAVTNLKPAKMRGIESTAMLLAASNDEKVELLNVPGDVPNGELVSFEGKEASEPDGMLKSKGALKVWERVKTSLKAGEDGEAAYFQEEGGPFKMLTTGGPVKPSTLTNAVIQ